MLLCIVLVMLAGVVPYFVPLDLLRTELAARVARDTQRSLNIQGSVRFVLLPRPALLLGEASLTEPASPAVFAHFNKARVGLAVWPLISRGEVVVRELEFDKPKITVLRHEDGSLNFEDLLTQSKEDQGLHFDLEELHFKSAELGLSDEFLGNTVTLSQLDLHLRNLADPKNGKLTVAGGLLVGKQGQPAYWQGQLKVDAAMRYNEQERRLLVADLKLNLAQLGDSAPELRISQGNLTATGNLIYGWQPLRLTGGELKLNGEIVRAEQKWKLDLDLPEIGLHGTYLALNRLKLNAAMESPNGNVSAKIEVPALAGAQQSLLRADSARIDVKVGSPYQNLTLAFASPLELRRGVQFVLPGYRLTGSYGNRSLPRGAIPFDLQGEGLLDLRQEALDLASRGTLDHAPINTRLHLDDFVSPHYKVDLDLAKLDLSPYLPAVAANAKVMDQEEPFDLWWLNRLEAEGSVRIGELILQKLHINNLAFKLAATKRKMVLDPLSATIYEGQLTGRAEVDASRHVPVFHLQQKLSDMNINPLLADVLATSRFEGRGFLDLDVAAVGKKLSDLRRTAGGNVRVQLRKGAIRGIDVEAVLRAAANQLKQMGGQATAQPANLNARTHFSELNASLSLKHGVASNSDLNMSAGVLKLVGSGVVDLGSGTLDYLVKASANPKVPELSDLVGLTLPIQFSGLLASPEYKVDYASLKEQLLARKKAAEAKPVSTKKHPVKPASKSVARPVRKKK
ncbi:MAG: AsmA family protein [Formivibrio sp.]|nr:AsmA family protein [Formivibrio sp.]